MASLCISTPVQAGIIPFSTPNSSFILNLLRRSIKLWAVFLAIFLPTAVVGLPSSAVLSDFDAAVALFGFVFGSGAHDGCVLEEAEEVEG